MFVWNYLDDSMLWNKMFLSTANYQHVLESYTFLSQQTWCFYYHYVPGKKWILAACLGTQAYYKDTGRWERKRDFIKVLHYLGGKGILRLQDLLLCKTHTKKCVPQKTETQNYAQKSHSILLSSWSMRLLGGWLSGFRLLPVVCPHAFQGPLVREISSPCIHATDPRGSKG